MIAASYRILKKRPLKAFACYGLSKTTKSYFKARTLHNLKRVHSIMLLIFFEERVGEKRGIRQPLSERILDST